MLRVGVVRGGISPEYEISLNTGAHVLSHLKNKEMKNNYRPVDIFIDRDGYWHLNGRSTDLETISKRVDIIFNALHGDFGEDGKIQQIFEQWKMPYTGSGPFTSALCYNKLLTKNEFLKLGVKTPKHILFPAYFKDMDGEINEYARKKAKEVHSKMSPPRIVKPVTGGSSMGIFVCKTFDDLILSFQVGANEKTGVIVEEMILGKEATVGVIDNFRGKKIYTLPPSQKGICPGNFSRQEKEDLESLAKLIHSNLNLSHYSEVDFIIHPKQGIYVLEVNSLPNLSKGSIMLKSLEAVGVMFPEFLAHIINLIKNKK